LRVSFSGLVFIGRTREEEEADEAIKQRGFHCVDVV